EPVGYLYRIVRNLALDRRRKERNERHVLSVDSLGSAGDILPDRAPSPEAAALYEDEMKALTQAIAELPERTRIAVAMHHAGCRLKEIAGFLGLSVAMAHVLVADGIQHCKHRLNWP